MKRTYGTNIVIKFFFLYEIKHFNQIKLQFSIFINRRELSIIFSSLYKAKSVRKRK